MAPFDSRSLDPGPAAGHIDEERDCFVSLPRSSATVPVMTEGCVVRPAPLRVSGKARQLCSICVRTKSSSWFFESCSRSDDSARLRQQGGRLF